MPSLTARKLIEIRNEWVCSQCGYQFYNPGCVLTGLTLNEIVQHVKKMREQAFVNHVCLTALSDSAMRRSQRILATVSLTVTGESPSGFFIEDTNTLVVNAHGALLMLLEKISLGQLLRLKNNMTLGEEECRVVFLALVEQGGNKVGVEFTRPVAHFWHITSPPRDWR